MKMLSKSGIKMLCPFGAYVDEVLEMVVEDFSPAYKYVFSRYWNNSFEARMPCNYTKVFWDEGLLETYIPVIAHSEMNLRYHRVVVKVVPEIDQQGAKELAVELMEKRQKPNGIVDSESIFIVSPRRKGWTHGFRHVPLRGHQTCVIVNRNPLKVIEILKRLLWKFIESRILGMLKKFGITVDCPANEIWYKKSGSFYYNRCYNNRNTRFRLYRHIRLMIRCLSHFLDWLKRKAKERLVKYRILLELRKIPSLSNKKRILNSLWSTIVRGYNDYQTRKALALLSIMRSHKPCSRLSYQ